ncbi:MAG: SMODS domain-containing nucleotidyltransferase [Thermodesulfobacteriota bacterium]
MAKTVSQAFQEFMQRYEPSPWQKDTISRHHNYIRSVLANKINIVEDFLTGSYIKQTQIKPPTDIDLFIVLDLKYEQSYYPNNANKLLNNFKKLLQQTYPYSCLKPDGQAVVIEFSDGIKMDVVPAFQRKNSGYLIPNANKNTFIPTDPKQYNDLLSNGNQALDRKLKPIIKMIKCWSVTWWNLLRSSHIEIISLNCFCDLSQGKCYPFEDYQYGLEIFFRKAKSCINNPSYEPIVGDKIDSYLDSYVPINQQSYRKIDVLAHLFGEHHKKILKAIQLQNSGYHREAIEIWKELFDDYFPSY